MSANEPVSRQTWLTHCTIATDNIRQKMLSTLNILIRLLAADFGSQQSTYLDLGLNKAKTYNDDD